MGSECAKLTFREYHIQLERSALPKGVLLSGNGAFPVLQIKGSLAGAMGLCDEPERVIASPLLSIQGQSLSAFSVEV